MENKFFYAIYKGDKFIDLCDTIYQVAQRLNCSIDSAKFLTYPSVRKRSHGNRTLVYKYTRD